MLATSTFMNAWGRRLSFAMQYTPALAVAAAILLFGVIADHQKKLTYGEYLRADVTERMSVLRARLEGNITGNLELIRGLVVALENRPDMDQVTFAAMSSRLLCVRPQIRSVAAAPDYVVSMVYPIQGNQSVLGLNYMNNPAQREGARQAGEFRRLIVTGPIGLVQGGTGLLARYPVLVDTPQGSQKLWGILSSVIDVEKLFTDSGLMDPELKIDVALISVTPLDKVLQHFFGRASILEEDPVRMKVSLGQEQWILAGVPKAGWQQSPPDIWHARLVVGIIGGLMIVAVAMIARLSGERQKHRFALRQREEDLAVLSKRLDMALEASRIGVWELDLDTGALIWDERMRELYGIETDAPLCHESWYGSLHPDDAERVDNRFTDSICTGRQFDDQFRIVTGKGEVAHVRANGAHFRTADGHRKIVGVNWNISKDVQLQEELSNARQQAEQKTREIEQARQHMEYNSLHDTLTGLPNRRYLDEKLAEMNRAAMFPLAILHIDLDRFKDINDTLGHAAGDEILKHTAAILQDAIKDGEFTARIGGDEFLIVSRVRSDATACAQLAQELVEALNKPVSYAGHECRIGASIGVATRASRHEPTGELLVNADIALYEAKRQGRNRVAIFNDMLRSDAIYTKRTADEILRGLETDAFVPYFQPQFSAATYEIVGVEALARWSRSDGLILTPDAFLKIAENLNVVSSIDAAILELALVEYWRWQTMGLGIPRFSVNISAQRLRDERLFARLSKLEIPRGALCFELLESISFDDRDEILLRSVERIRDFGIDIEIDDFGTGYASIVSLLNLSPRRLKIDRQLIAPMLDSPAQRHLVASIIDIGKSRGIEIIAEGVETMAHADMLRDLGCDILQGYAFAPPMAAQDFLRFAAERTWIDDLRREAV